MKALLLPLPMQNHSSPTAQATPEIIAIVNQKGGVGKTTTSINLATAMAAIQKNVLLIDCDPQGNASTGLAITDEQRTISTYDLLLAPETLEDAILPTAIPKLSIIPADMNLSGAEIELVNLPEREFCLKKALAHLPQHFDYVFIDCPPSLGLLTLNCLVSAHHVLIPLQCEFYALEGLSHLLKTVDLVKHNLNATLDIKGILLTMYDRRNKCTEQIEYEVRDYFDEKVYKTVIPRNVRISEAPSHGMPAIVYDMHCPGSRAYIRLAREMLKKSPTTQPQALETA